MTGLKVLPARYYCYWNAVVLSQQTPWRTETALFPAFSPMMMMGLKWLNLSFLTCLWTLSGKIQFLITLSDSFCGILKTVVVLIGISSAKTSKRVVRLSFLECDSTEMQKAPKLLEVRFDQNVKFQITQTELDFAFTLTMIYASHTLVFYTILTNII